MCSSDLLAVEVVTRAREFESEHRRRTVLEMRTRLAEFQHVLAGLDRATNAELWAMARDAVDEMQRVVSEVAPR